MSKVKVCISNRKPNECNTLPNQKEEEEKEEKHIYDTLEELEIEQMYDMPLKTVNRRNESNTLPSQKEEEEEKEEEHIYDTLEEMV